MMLSMKISSNSPWGEKRNQENERLFNETLLCEFLDKEIELEFNFIPWGKVVFEKVY